MLGGRPAEEERIAMADYGHSLEFGTFTTPSAAEPATVVALAQLAERSGFDLVTFQDHPYQPAFLDTWTLMSWVAASTERVRVSPNVLNLPLRHPSVVARSAASLDLLSGGRVDLALGAGAFWDAIVAMGGERRTPGESVVALGEAIDVIRGLWDTSLRGGVRVDGEHYRVKGAKRGPAPAHDIPIALGAYKPRMLGLTGTKADGWLPSLMNLDLATVPDSNARIDAAAADAGRDPREVRRMLNVGGTFGPAAAGERTLLGGPPEQWAEQLAELALTHGFSTFILASDVPADVQRFGEEVIPAVREAVGRERAATGTTTPEVLRGPKALALRSEGIDYDGLPASLTTRAVEPGDKAYAKVRSTYIRSGSPGLVLQPRSAEEVVDALAFARAQDVPLAIRSGGHGISGRSTNHGGVVIDLGQLNEIQLLDPATGRIRLGPGARWGDVAVALQAHGLAMSSGDYGDVGVGGLATAGGVGLLGRKYGLTIDHVVAAEIVLADGRLVRADADHHPDLFWAIRGAGGNFGIVTAFELEAYPLGNVVHSTMVLEAGPGLLERWGSVVEASPRELTSFLMLGRQGRDAIAQLMTVFAGDDIDAATSALTPLLSIGPVLQQQASLVPYAAVVPPHGGVQLGGGMGEPAFRSGIVDHITPEVDHDALVLVTSGAAPFFQLRAVGGAVNDVDPLATAYAHRSQNFVASGVGASRPQLDEAWDAGLGRHSTGLYLSFNTDPRPERLAEAFPGETLTRLRALKTEYDPDNVFDQNLPIAPREPAART